MSTSTGHSFVYPVKSLLTGNILPATQEEPPPTDRQSSRRLRKRNARGLKAERVSSPNFRHYPGDDALAEPSFATAPVPGPSKVTLDLSSASPTTTGDNHNLSDPDSLSFYTASGPSPPESSPLHTPNFSEVTSDVLSNSVENLELYPRSHHPQLSTSINMTDTSIVHLPPPRSASCSALRIDTLTPSTCIPHASDLHSTGYSSYLSNEHAHQSTPRSLHGPLPSSHQDVLDDVGSSFTVNLGQISAPLLPPSSSSVSSGSDAHETGRSGRSTGGYSSSDEPLVTFRFDHREDGDGHHIVIGREGKLSRCEDEVRTALCIFYPRFRILPLAD